MFLLPPSRVILKLLCTRKKWCNKPCHNVFPISFYPPPPPPPTQGNDCEIDLNLCRSSPCMNGGTCTNSPNTYSCACLPSFTDLDCSVELDACVSSPCVNGTCVVSPTCCLKNASFLYFFPLRCHNCYIYLTLIETTSCLLYLYGQSD